MLQIRKLSNKTWKHIDSIDGAFILTKFYAKEEFNEFLIVESYGAKRRKYLINEIEVYNIGGTAETFANFEDLFLRLEALKYTGFYKEGDIDLTWGSITGTLSDQVDLQNALDSKADLVGGKVPASQLPSYVDDVIEGYFNGTNFYTDSGFTNLITPESGKIYINIAVTPATQYRWSGSAYVQIGSNVKNIVTNTSVTGTFNLDANLTDTYVLTLTGNTTLSLINFSSTIAQQMTIYITGNFALTYPSGAKVFGNYSTTKTNQLVLEKVGSSTYITINNYV